MKKVLFILIACAVAVSFGAPAMAKQGLSAGIGFGILGNAGQLGGTICDNGLDQSVNMDLHPAAATLAPGYDNLILVEAEDTLLDKARTTAFNPTPAITNVTTSGAMSALDIQVQVRYDFLGYLFARTGINYGMKLSGGDTSWKYNGVKQTQEWDYNHMIIPITLGLNLPIGEKFNVFAGLTMAYVSGGWSLDMSRTYLRSDMDGGTAPNLGIGQFMTSQFAGVRQNEKVEFEISGISFGYVLGVSAEVYENVNVFFELETVVLADYDQAVVGNATLKGLGITHFNKYTVVGGNTMRFGATYNFGFATI